MPALRSLKPRMRKPNTSGLRPTLLSLLLWVAGLLVCARCISNRHPFSSLLSHIDELISNPRSTKLLFKSNQLSERGTETAIFDYAVFAERYFHVQSLFVFKRLVSTSALRKFESKFPGRVFLPPEEAMEDEEKSAFVRQVAAEIRPDAFYLIEAGDAQLETIDNTTNLVHAVFSCEHKHGDKYVAISDFVYHTGRQCEGIVPHMV